MVWSTAKTEWGFNLGEKIGVSGYFSFFFGVERERERERAI